MSSSLPSESAAGCAVNDFGLGPWDSNPSSSKGEDEEGVRSEFHPRGKSIPDAGGSTEEGPEPFSSYASFVQDDYLRAIGRGEISSRTSQEEWDAISSGTTLDEVTGASELPFDENNPSSRSDYYDRMTIGGGTTELWPSEDSGVYAQEEEDALPGVEKNEVTVDNFLNSLGNYWSGTITEDISGPTGHPIDDITEVSDSQQERQIYTSSEGFRMNRKATNHAIVTDLTASFLKEFGKKDLTRRHVMAFLQKQGYHQYLASDIIRCLKLSHSVFVKDVLDEFPVVKTATQGGISLSKLRDTLIHLEASNITNPDVAYHFRRCAARISQVMADLERLEARNG